ncbi:hypothetical protein ANOM_011853 [Aspergillus nomiae NRRL 13137]|uniref:Uncharacterized protein n=1 Tax=Aspergillus nomiae NRRL (strain ATCC 15546 / NRRL 13137 / CBS 260.88 / M93) TaxID=1509407 RepID=A0A0L1ILQ0_ASPN3|nr:uncharacterized protein ANOM_011853 [Aspergillus nomiae NRRL 13137]KNG80479.1 hypothetical protein ANOM_011853 [Aspergillus nomiae NRRL 13137]
MARREDHLARQVSSERSDTVTEVTFDINSIVGFASSLTVAKQGVRWNPTQMAVSDLQSSLHLDPLPVQYLDPQGRSHGALRAVHETPHYTFGRLTGFEDISLTVSPALPEGAAVQPPPGPGLSDLDGSGLVACDLSAPRRVSRTALSLQL